MLANGAPTSFCSAMQKFVILFMTEAEIATGILVVQNCCTCTTCWSHSCLRLNYIWCLKWTTTGLWILSKVELLAPECITWTCEITFWANSSPGLLIIRHISGDSNEVDILVIYHIVPFCTQYPKLYPNLFLLSVHLVFDWSY